MEPHVHLSPLSIAVDVLKLGLILLVIRLWAMSRQRTGEQSGKATPIADTALAIYG